MIELKQCPVCGGADFTEKTTITDHSISKEQFNIVTCSNCDFTFTNPLPDQNEIGKYYSSQDYISHSDTKKGLINNLYHRIRKHSLSQKHKLISKEIPNGKILDIGCGTGYFLNFMQGKGWKVTGMEPESSARELAEKNTGRKIYSDINQINETGFNVITLWHVLEHIHDLPGAFEVLQSSLDKKGVLIIAVPNLKSYDAVHYKEFWAAYDLPRHLYHFSPKSLEILLNKNGFTLFKKEPMPFDSFYVSMLSEKYKNKGQIGITGLIKAFSIGLLSNLKSTKKNLNNSSIIYLAHKK